jgi:hypothetical protein
MPVCYNCRMTAKRWFGILGILSIVLAAIMLATVALNRLGTTRIEPQDYALLGEGGDPLVVMVGFPWAEDGFCSGQFTIEVTETATEIRVGAVVSRNVHIGACAGIGTLDGRAAVGAFLSAPLGDRRVIRASDGAELPPYQGRK